MQRLTSIFLLFFIPLLALQPVSAKDKTFLDAEELVKLAPRISLEENSINTFEARGTFEMEGVLMRFKVFGRKPDQVAILFEDPSDGAPILFATSKAMMFYDPLEAQLYGSKAVSDFNFKAEKNKAGGIDFFMDFAFFLDPKNTRKDRVLIDIHSFLKALNSPLKVEKVNGQSFRLSGRTQKGGRIIAEITPSRKEGAYKKVEMYIAGSQRPFFVVDEIKLNQPISDSRFVFPEKALEDSALPLDKLDNESKFKAVFSAARIVRAMMARLALTGLEGNDYRSTLEKMSSKKIDWEKVKAQDEKISKALKSILMSK